MNNDTGGVNWELLKEFLKSKTGVAKFNSGRTELICRCFNCEIDSENIKRNHGHLYIKADETYLVFNCFKCETSGSLAKLIRELDGRPSDFIDKELLNRKFVGSGKARKTVLNQDRIIPKFISEKFSTKLVYLRGRLGSDYILENIPRLVLDIKDFFEKNRIALNSYDRNLMDRFQTSFVGFVTSRGLKLILRNCDNTSNFRYHKINLNSDGSGHNDFYGLAVNNIISGTNNIVLCEGIFDLFVGKECTRLKDIKDKSCYWAAVLGNNYQNQVDFVLDHCCLPFSDLTILSDDNIKESKYLWLSKNVRVGRMDIVWNDSGKDFGSHPINPVSVRFDKQNFEKNYWRNK